MINWKSSLILPSEIAEGVRYHFNRFSAGRRSDLELALADYRTEVTRKSVAYSETVETVPLVARMVKIQAEDQGGAETEVERQVPDEDSAEHRRNKARLAGFLEELRSMQDRVERSAALRAFLKRVEGIGIDGVEMTVEQFIAEGPEELADEAYRLIQKHGGMSEAERKNLQPPSTSREAEGGGTISTDAQPVSAAENSPADGV